MVQQKIYYQSTHHIISEKGIIYFYICKQTSYIGELCQCRFYSETKKNLCFFCNTRYVAAEKMLVFFKRVIRSELRGRSLQEPQNYIWFGINWVIAEIVRLTNGNFNF